MTKEKLLELIHVLEHRRDQCFEILKNDETKVTSDEFSRSYALLFQLDAVLSKLTYIPETEPKPEPEQPEKLPITVTTNKN